MAGKIVVSTLNNDTGVLATQNGMTGIAKAWVNFNGSTAAINSGFNVGSITKNATGNYTLNFTTAMPNANYSVALGQVGYATNNYSTFLFIRPSSVLTPALKTTTQLQIAYVDAAGNGYDAIDINVSIFSS